MRRAEQTRLPARTCAERGIDPASLVGIGLRGTALKELEEDQKERRRLLQDALNEARRKGADQSQIDAIEESLEGINDDIYETVTQQIENARELVEATAQAAVDKAQRQYGILQAQQRVAFAFDTPEAMRKRAEFLRDVIIPALRAQITAAGGVPMMQRGGPVEPRMNGTPVIVGEGGHREWVLSEDPRYRARTDLMIKQFFKATGRARAAGYTPPGYEIWEPDPIPGWVPSPMPGGGYVPPPGGVPPYEPPPPPQPVAVDVVTPAVATAVVDNSAKIETWQQQLIEAIGEMVGLFREAARTAEQIAIELHLTPEPGCGASACRGSS